MSGPGRRYLERRRAELADEEYLEPGGELELELDVAGDQAPSDWALELKSDDLLDADAIRALGLWSK